MKRILIQVLVAVVALVLIASLFARALAVKAVAWAVERETGLGVEIGGMEIGRFSPWFEITDFRLMNPEEFGAEAFVHIAKLRVSYKPFSLFSDSVEIPFLHLDIPRVLIIEEEGKSNVDPLIQKRMSSLPAPRAGSAESPAEDSSPADEKPLPSMPELKSGHKKVSIGRLDLKLGTLETRRRAAGEDEPLVQEFPFDETYVFTNVTSPEQIIQRLAAGFLIKQISSGMREP